MTTKLPALCDACTRYRPDDESCTSFPDGIPDDILNELADHRSSRTGEPTFLLDDARLEAFDAWFRAHAALGSA